MIKLGPNRVSFSAELNSAGMTRDLNHKEMTAFNQLKKAFKEETSDIAGRIDLLDFHHASGYEDVYSIKLGKENKQPILTVINLKRLPAYVKTLKQYAKKLLA